MAPEQQLLQFLQAHIHILIWNLHPANQTHTRTLTYLIYKHRLKGSLCSLLVSLLYKHLCVHCILHVPHLWSVWTPTCPLQVSYSFSPPWTPQSPSPPEQTGPLRRGGQEVQRSRRHRRSSMLWPLLRLHCLLFLLLSLLDSQAPLW